MAEQSLESKLEKLPEGRWHIKIREWLRRYGLAEIIGTAAAYAGYCIARELTDNEIISAYAGTMGENLGFYGTIISREVVADIKKAKSEARKYRLADVLKSAGKLIAEFGPAEALDSLIVRPAAMGYGCRIFGKELGIGIGKIAADVTFYIPTVISYELRRRFSKSETTAIHG